jgi:hypothetical protein
MSTHLARITAPRDIAPAGRAGLSEPAARAGITAGPSGKAPRKAGARIDAPYCKTMRRPLLVLMLFCLAAPGWSAADAATNALAVSVYATASDVLEHLVPAEARAATLSKLRALRISRVFLEGRRGDEYVPAVTLGAVRDALAAEGIRTSGGIATVPGAAFGTRQNEALGWLNWEDAKTRRDVAGFFTENAPVFDELIVDDFFCTGDTSAASVAARGSRSWSEYRRDRLVSLIQPLMFQPAREARPDVRLIIKFPQWYDRFHLFGYDPARMAVPFDQVWVGTEVRNPLTRRMGFVQPTEGYVNFRWISSVCGAKTTGAWFDHIECTPENFLDQAFQSVLAGARELTLFRLGDIAADHPGDALLARRLPELFDLAAKVQRRARRGVTFYKPANSEAADNLYLADYLGMLGVPVLPEARFPEQGKVVFLGAQAAADPRVTAKLGEHLANGGTGFVTPAFLRRAGADAQRLAGVAVGDVTQPAVAEVIRIGSKSHPLTRPLEVDGAVAAAGTRIRFLGNSPPEEVPVLLERRVGRGRLFVLNARTFSEDDFRAEGEWLLSPKPRGWSELPPAVADALRRVFLGPLRVQLEAPAGVGLYLFDRAACLYNFRDTPTPVKLDGSALTVPAHGYCWVDSR